MSKITFTRSFTNYFIQAPITPLILVVIMMLGVLALINLPREEEPQISVPMVDILLQANGLKAIDVEELVTKPLEVIIKSIDQVEHIYSQTEDNKAVVTARFFVGSDRDNAVLRVHEKIRAHLAEIPYSIPMPIVSAKGIDDVAILAINLTPKPKVANRWNDTNLFEIALNLQQELIKTENIGSSYIVGGRPQQLRVEPLAEKMMLYHITISQIIDKIRASNITLEAGQVRTDNQLVTINVGNSLQNIDDLRNILISSLDGKAIYLNDLANIKAEGRPLESRVWNINKNESDYLPSITIAFAKRPGSNAANISKEIKARLEFLKDNFLPNSLDVTITRDYGETAQEKSNRLLEDLIGATVSVVILVLFALGKRESLVVLITIPATIILTLFIAWISGFTINRVTLFALIFSIGILVDDAIVFIENIVRHWRLFPLDNKIELAVNAIEEVGRPTIVATITIILALLPMLFVSGMMGPYMSPIPINASVAMLISLFVAFAIAPWLLLKVQADKKEVLSNKNYHKDNFLAVIYRKYANILVEDRSKAKRFLLLLLSLTIVAILFFPTKQVIVKMLPFDNKSEIVIQIDMKEGVTLEDTERTMRLVSNKIRELPEIENMQLYVGVAAPFNFNGLVKHSYLRNQPNLGEIQINLLPKNARKRTSHEISQNIRQELESLGLKNEVVFKILEVPPGPPVLATLLAEIYGEDSDERREVALELKDIFNKIDFITDIDDSFKNQAENIRVLVNQDKINYHKVNESDVYNSLRYILGHNKIGYSYKNNGRYPTEISIELPKSQKVLSESLFSLPIRGAFGYVQLKELVTIVSDKTSFKIFRHNGYNVDMITAELTGKYEAPIYAMLAVDQEIKKHDWKNLEKPKILFHRQPLDESKPSILWDGEWEVTYVTFRDMGIAFAVAIFGMYCALVVQFRNFRTPLAVLLPVPLTVIGIVFGHYAFSVNFTATSMIGMIALAGIVVRNSLLVIEFINHLRTEGHNLKHALVEAGAVRILPICLTAITAMIGAVFMFFDPIFQGLAISLFFGLISSTILTLFAIPALYIWIKTK